MIRLEGGAGAVFVEYQRTTTLGPWFLTFDHRAGLNVRRGSGTAKLVHADPFWSVVPPTRVELRVGPTTWIWKDVSVQIHGPIVDITVQGDPDIRRTEEHHGA